MAQPDYWAPHSRTPRECHLASSFPSRPRREFHRACGASQHLRDMALGPVGSASVRFLAFAVTGDRNRGAVVTVPVVVKRGALKRALHRCSGASVFGFACRLVGPSKGWIRAQARGRVFPMQWTSDSTPGLAPARSATQESIQKRPGRTDLLDEYGPRRMEVDCGLSRDAAFLSGRIPTRPAEWTRICPPHRMDSPPVSTGSTRPGLDDVG